MDEPALARPFDDDPLAEFSTEVNWTRALSKLQNFRKSIEALVRVSSWTPRQCQEVNAILAVLTPIPPKSMAEGQSAGKATAMEHWSILVEMVISTLKARKHKEMVTQKSDAGLAEMSKVPGTANPSISQPTGGSPGPNSQDVVEGMRDLVFSDTLLGEPGLSPVTAAILDPKPGTSPSYDLLENSTNVLTSSSKPSFPITTGIFHPPPASTFPCARSRRTSTVPSPSAEDSAPNVGENAVLDRGAGNNEGIEEQGNSAKHGGRDDGGEGENAELSSSAA
ncbi:uncharacterized protein L3040_005406 [Drepanopeziza brunnea f. sp. 'multigermtubi']|uniref:Uncharacterized protein n=1 Tax=Marssonina brunnea f. sp. multigermtubi (strain MB_m1) TaxID=1072389 RepID=K1X900_MARBU|nr:uncharacterized protein MBM_04765 [Drepanopeziza brunnea f. sp. 'multigermtubi' MB_m1]EKD17188.1 hypothetical protein MBM_04765 [Drepanopeziza brunnea f. sp. 'multigermtubi' MB_m1]KAJ5041840.1 hypothetical protein L3040_005406 [Drepanopeziza brunnea f. sp. 'multigermtubi']